MPRTIKIAAVQMIANPAPTAERLGRAETLIADAAAEGAQLVVLPEMFNTGYIYSDTNYQRAEPLDGPTAAWMKRLAAEHSIHLAGTLYLLDEEDIYNTLLLVAPDGRTWRYDKTYPWQWERAYYRGGEQITVADTDLGKLGMMICWDSMHVDLWARYAGKVDAMVIASCPPAMHHMTFIMPDGQQVSVEEIGSAMNIINEQTGMIFGDLLRRQAAHIGIPAVNTTGTGQLFSPLPLPALTLYICSLMGRFDLLKYLPQAALMRGESGYFNDTWIADAFGNVLGQVAAEEEGYTLAEVTLADSPPQPTAAQPAFGISRVIYMIDQFANIALTPLYRRKVRRYHGPHMAPVAHQTKLWIGAAAAAVAIGFLIGRAGRKR